MEPLNAGGEKERKSHTQQTTSGAGPDALLTWGAEGPLQAEQLPAPAAQDSQALQAETAFTWHRNQALQCRC